MSNKHNILNPPIGTFPVYVVFDDKKQKWQKRPGVAKGTSWQQHKPERGFKDSENFGVTIPQNILVIDLDISEGITLEDLQASIEIEFDAEFEVDWNEAFLQRTISGGAHYAFTIPSDIEIIQQTNCRDIPGFDLRVAGKGWICSGKDYSTENSNHDDIISALYSGELPSLPSIITDSLGQIKVSDDDSDDDFMSIVADNTLGLSDADIIDYMSRLPESYADDQDNWFRVGMALYHETKGSDFGWELFDEFSNQCPEKYDENANRSRWESFGGNKNSKLTFASIIKWAKDSEKEERFAALDETDISRTRAKEACDEGAYLIRNQLGFDIEYDLDIAHMIVSSSFWQPKEGKLHTINSDDLTVMLSEKDTLRMLVKLFGNPISNFDMLCQAITDLAVDDEGPKLSKADQNNLKHAVMNALFDTIKIHNQRTALKMDVDMFAKRTSFEFDSSHAIEHYKHVPLVARCIARYDEEALADYKRHFPEVDDVLKFIIAARFADNRKKAYLWLKAPSDWGKDFFRVALGSIATEISVKEVEKAMEGAPVGKSPTDFLRSMVMVTNEFKSVKSELKQLEDSITLSAKYQLETQVPLYTKLFMSAEGVDSLVGEYGIESQFANRFSLITGEGDIAKLPGFGRLGPLFIDVIKTYFADFMNAEIKRYQVLGLNNSMVEAFKVVNGFHKRHGIANTNATIEDSLESLADLIKENLWNNHTLNWIDEGTHKYLKSPRTAINNVLFSGDVINRSEAYTLKYKIDEICAIISEDGKGVHDYKVHGKTIKAIKMLPGSDGFDKINDDF